MNKQRIIELNNPVKSSISPVIGLCAVFVLGGYIGVNQVTKYAGRRWLAFKDRIVSTELRKELGRAQFTTDKPGEQRAFDELTEVQKWMAYETTRKHLAGCESTLGAIKGTLQNLSK